MLDEACLESREAGRTRVLGMEAVWERCQPSILAGIS